MNDAVVKSNEACPCCPRGCSLSAPSYGRGRAYAERFVTGESSPAGAVCGDHRRGPHGGPMPEPDRLEGLLLRCGHRLHHGGPDQCSLFSALTPDEQELLQRLLQRLLQKLLRA